MSESRTFSVTVKDCLVNLLALGDLYEAIATGESDNGFRIRADEAAAVMRASAHFISEFASDIGFSKWVSVKARLPWIGETIWGFDGKEPFLCEYSCCGFQTYGASCDREGLNSQTLFGVTHWMEIACPESPKKD
jgi:hypothetical protein